jgi:hypothetical protein
MPIHVELFVLDDPDKWIKLWQMSLPLFSSHVIFYVIYQIRISVNITKIHDWDSDFICSFAILSSKNNPIKNMSLVWTTQATIYIGKYIFNNYVAFSYNVNSECILKAPSEWWTDSQSETLFCHVFSNQSIDSYLSSPSDRNKWTQSWL